MGALLCMLVGHAWYWSLTRVGRAAQCRRCGAIRHLVGLDIR